MELICLGLNNSSWSVQISAITNRRAYNTGIGINSLKRTYVVGEGKQIHRIIMEEKYTWLNGAIFINDFVIPHDKTIALENFKFEGKTLKHFGKSQKYLVP